MYLYVIFETILIKKNVSIIARFVLFADDLNLFVSHSDRKCLYQIANTILHDLYEYCHLNRLIINYDKCCFMEFNKSQDDDEKFALGILNSPFLQVSKCKFLGVYINDNLSWDDHIKYVTGQVSKSCGSIYSIKSCVPLKILRKIYMALVQSYLIYCIPLWGSLHKSASLNKLFILQKKCIRLINNRTKKIDGIFPHTKPLFKKSNVLTVFNLYYYMTCIEATKIVQFESPIAIYEFFDISIRSQRFIIPKFRLSKIMNKSFIYNSSKILNYLLQQDIKYYELSPDNFKTRLKKHLTFTQSLSINGDDEWLPCNHDIFSDVTF